jgi:hypothetical protein
VNENSSSAQTNSSWLPTKIVTQEIPDSLKPTKNVILHRHIDASLTNNVSIQLSTSIFPHGMTYACFTMETLVAAHR